MQLFSVFVYQMLTGETGMQTKNILLTKAHLVNGVSPTES